MSEYIKKRTVYDKDGNASIEITNTSRTHSINITSSFDPKTRKYTEVVSVAEEMENSNVSL